MCALGQRVGHRVLAHVDPRARTRGSARASAARGARPRAPPRSSRSTSPSSRGKALEIQRVPLQTGGVQEPVGRRNPPPGDLDDGQAVHVQVDERVEEVERERAHRHGPQDTRVRWIVQGENLDVLRALPDGARGPDLRRSAVQHRPHAQSAPACARARARRRRRPHRLRRAALRERGRRHVRVRRPLRRPTRVSRAAPARGAPRARAPTARCSCTSIRASRTT